MNSTPKTFRTGQSNIPESGNGIPDILDEAKYELDWYLKMQMKDAHVLAGVRVKDLAGFKSPPSNDHNPRFYSPPTPKAEAIFVADLSHAARVMEGIPRLAAYASKLKSAARLTWDAHVKKGKIDEFTFWAACEWLRIEKNDKEASDIIHKFKKRPSYWLNFLSYEDFGIYAYLQNDKNGSDLASGMKTDLGVRTEDILKTRDAFDSPMRDWYYSNGSNRAKTEHGIGLWMSARLGVVGSHQDKEIFSRAEDYLHFIHGTNPMGMTYLTNAEALGAKHGIWQPWSMWFQGPLYSGKPENVVDPLFPYLAGDGTRSKFGPPPGYSVVGSNFAYAGGSRPPLLRDGKKPAMAKAYRDYFSGAGKSWEVNEVGIYFTSSYLLLASMFVPSEGGD